MPFHNSTFINFGDDSNFKEIVNDVNKNKDITSGGHLFSNHSEDNIEEFFNNNMEINNFPSKQDEFFNLVDSTKSLEQCIVNWTRQNNKRIFTVALYNEKDGTVEFFNGLTYEMAKKKKVELGDTGNILVWINI